MSPSQACWLWYIILKVCRLAPRARVQAQLVKLIMWILCVFLFAHTIREYAMTHITSIFFSSFKACWRMALLRRLTIGKVCFSMWLLRSRGTPLYFRFLSCCRFESCLTLAFSRHTLTITVSIEWKRRINAFKRNATVTLVRRVRVSFLRLRCPPGADVVLNICI